jgi:hypothetical protein
MNRTDAALYLGAIGVLLALHISAPIIVAFLTGALLADATRGDGP